MNVALVVECTALVLLLCCSAFFSSSETALFSLSNLQVHRIRRDHAAAGRRIASILSSPRQLLSTILIGNTLVNVVASVLSYAVAIKLFPVYGEAISIVVMTLSLLMFGEIAPKRLAMRFSERMAVVYSAPLTFLITVLKPARLLLRAVTRWFDERLTARGKHLTEDEFRSAVSMSEAAGVLDREERSMVDGIIRLEDIQASEIMTPRVDLIGLDLEDELDVWRETARRAKVHYLPVYREDLDHVVAFLDVLKFLLGRPERWEEASVPVVYVPETVTLDVLLSRFQREDLRLAIVADEFGGTAGLVTLGDVLEEIVEDVEDEYGDGRMTIEPIGPNRWLIEGDTSLEDVNYELEVDLEADGVDRISGWVTAQLGHIPRTGEEVEGQGCRVTVRRVRRTRITMVQLERLELAPEAEEDEDPLR